MMPPFSEKVLKDNSLSEEWLARGPFAKWMQEKLVLLGEKDPETLAYKWHDKITPARIRAMAMGIAVPTVMEKIALLNESDTWSQLQRAKLSKAIEGQKDLLARNAKNKERQLSQTEVEDVAPVTIPLRQNKAKEQGRIKTHYIPGKTSIQAHYDVISDTLRDELDEFRKRGMAAGTTSLDTKDIMTNVFVCASEMSRAYTYYKMGLGNEKWLERQNNKVLHKFTYDCAASTDSMRSAAKISASFDSLTHKAVQAGMIGEGVPVDVFMKEMLAVARNLSLSYVNSPDRKLWLNKAPQRAVSVKISRLVKTYVDRTIEEIMQLHQASANNEPQVNREAFVKHVPSDNAESWIDQAVADVLADGPFARWMKAKLMLQARNDPAILAAKWHGIISPQRIREMAMGIIAPTATERIEILLQNFTLSSLKREEFSKAVHGQKDLLAKVQDGSIERALQERGNKTIPSHEDRVMSAKESPSADRFAR